MKDTALSLDQVLDRFTARQQRDAEAKNAMTQQNAVDLGRFNELRDSIILPYMESVATKLKERGIVAAVQHSDPSKGTLDYGGVEESRVRLELRRLPNVRGHQYPHIEVYRSRNDRYVRVRHQDGHGSSSYDSGGCVTFDEFSEAWLQQRIVAFVDEALR